MLKRLCRMVMPMAILSAAVVANAAVSVITADQIQSLKKSDSKNVLILDVRTPGEFAGGRIPGALPMPMRDVAAKMASIPKDKKIVVVCASGVRSAAVADYLSKNGFAYVNNYAAGMMDWERRGLKMEK